MNRSPTDSAAEHAPMLSAEERTFLLRASRRALVRYFADGLVAVPETSTPALLEPRACFITLWRRNDVELRGCRGESLASRPLIDAVVQMTLSAALDDRRFQPVTANEVPQLRIEINALGLLYRITPEAVCVGQHGLCVVRGERRGLLLPEVPVEHGMDRTEFLRAVCWKAGLPENAWQSPSTLLYAFETTAWAEP